MSYYKEEKFAKEIEEKYLAMNEAEARAFQLASNNEFLFWSKKTFCKIIFFYTNSARNKALKRVGRIAPYRSGGRIAVRNLSLIDPADHPSSRRSRPSLITYYDISRANATVDSRGVSSGLRTMDKMPDGPVSGQWRSYDRNRLSVLYSVYSFSEQRWIDNTETFKL